MSKIIISPRTIVISAINLNKGGTLTILRDCLQYLSTLASEDNYRIVALVYKQELADYPNIEYIETQWPKKRWINRLWFEYISMNKISREIGAVYLWLSLHDTTPNVVAERRAVYCHNSFPFYKWKWRECFFAPKIVLLALFSSFIYQKNIHRNDFVIVQQQWLKDAIRHLFDLSAAKIVIASPKINKDEILYNHKQSLIKEYSFIYAASPDSHKNFECICQAVEILEKKRLSNFKVIITVGGKENKYAKWLMKSWGHCSALNFVGFLDRTTLFGYYSTCNCLIFPSKVETWGLPISEFSSYQKPMLLSDLPYAKETAAGNQQVAFFDPDRPDVLAQQMQQLIEGDLSFLKMVPKLPLEEPVAHSWDELFRILLKP
ncbi:glycosyltransferase family 4 protein [Pedobacter antarcticus]|uniref:glycosyltransferase family 4 protein n=1 Tax=Pedobacter antarcticus TaxID=34086 RepID=UPI00088F0D1B|nr:glycosyltransferase family 1 protein [Pedobacter antarcticus]SDL40028.1 Glycosyltransferase involved in cell wall bisynthesis [Pedobacter antarcticus]